MASWDGVDFGFTGDETGNFGPRHESGSALYQVDTLAVISPTGTVEENPKVKATSCGSHLCVAAGCHISLFNEDGSNYTGTLAFESNVNALAWCPGADFLVVGEQNGSVHFINMATQTPLFSKTFVETPSSGSPTYKDISCSLVGGSSHQCELLLLTSSTLYTLSMINLEDFSRGIENKDMSLLKDVQKKMKLTVTDVSTEHTEGALCAMRLGIYGNEIVTTGAGKSALSIWSQRNGTLTPVRRFRHYHNGKGIRKIAPLDKGRCLLTLDTNNGMFLWHAPTLTCVRHWPDHSVLDFSLLGTAVDNANPRSSLADEKLVILMESEDGESSSLSVRNLLTMAPEYVLALSNFTHLVESPPDQEFINFVEGVLDEKSRGPFIATLRLRCLSELQPETRFNRLLHKKQFEQAELLAKEFKLDVELVYNVKATGILDKLSPWGVDKFSDAELNQLLEEFQNCLNMIKDENAIVLFCTQATPPRMETCRELLLYAKKRLSESRNGHGDEKGGTTACLPSVTHDDLMTRVLVILHRLSTFHMAYGPDAFTPTEWDRFRSADMLEEIKEQFTAGAVLCASAIWRRHSCEFEQLLGENMICDLLEAIPESIASQKLVPWLAQDFLPYMIRKLPDCLDLVAFWLEQRALVLEILEPNGWPANGVAMAELLEACMSCRESSIQSSLITPTELATSASCNSSAYSTLHTQEEGDESYNFSRLHILVLELKALLSLHTKYRCSLTLDEYRKQTTESLTYRMLDRVPAVDMIPKEIVDVVRPYMKEQNLKEDKMLFQYVIDLGQRLGQSSMTCLEEVPWEVKAAVVISCISETEYKIKAVLRAVERAKVPWGKGISDLVEGALKLDHPLVAELKEQKRLVSFRMILYKYHMVHHNVLSEKTAMQLINYIVCQDQASAYEDALAVVDHFTTIDSNLVCERILKHYILKDKIADAVRFIKKLPHKRAIQVSSCLIQYVIRELNTTMMFDTMGNKRAKLNFTHAACEILTYLLTLEELDSDLREEFETRLYDLERIHSIQVEFSEFITYEEYLCATARKKLFEKVLIWSLSQKRDAELHRIPQDMDCGCLTSRKPGKGQTWNDSRIYRFADLVRIPRHEFKDQLALHAADNGEVKRAIKIAREIFEDNPGRSSATVLYKVAMRLCEIMAGEKYIETIMIAEVWDIAEVIHDFAALAVSHCDKDSLPEYIHFYKTCLMAYNVARQCETGDYKSSLQNSGTSRDPYEEWTYDNYYEEDGLVMDSSVALPLAYQYVVSFTSISTEHGDYTEEEISRISNQTLAMVQHLNENCQLWLALSYSVYTLNVILLRLLAPSMTATHENQEAENADRSRMNFVKTITSHGIKSINGLKEKIVQKIFKQRNCDHNLGLAFMLESSHDGSANNVMTSMIKAANQHFRQITNIANVGVDCSIITADWKMQNFFADVEKKAVWAHKLNKIGVTLKDETVLNTVKGTMALLPSIVKQKAVDISFLLQYARAFDLDENAVLLLFIENQLLPGEPSCGKDNPPEGDIGGEEETLLNLQLLRVQNVITLITLEEELLKKLLEIMEKIDPYDYERLMFVLERAIHIKPSHELQQKQQLLQYLFVYQRVVPPSHLELTYQVGQEQGDSESHLTHEARPISPRSKTRLAFHPLFSNKLWKILSPEFNAATLVMWKPIAGLLELPMDNLFMLTIQNIVRHHVDVMKAHMSGKESISSGQILSKAHCNWEETDTISETINSIKSILFSVSNYQTAMACTSWIIKELPMGSEKVLALKHSVQIAKQWYESCAPGSEEQQKAKATYTKFEDFHKRLATEQVLFQHHLGEAEHIALANKPTALIMELYKHSSIQKHSSVLSKISNLPDIHKVTEKIAAIYNADLDKIQLLMLEQWLPSTHQAPLDMSVTMDSETLDMTFASQDLDEDEVNLKRVVYLLQYGPLHKSVMFLLHYIYRNDSVTATMCKIRALRCLFQLTTPHILAGMDFDKLKAVTLKEVRNVTVLREYLVTLVYQYELERLGISYTAESFKKSNKDGMVRSIWRKHRHEKRAVRLVTNLCLDFEILDVQLWNIILQQLLAFKMVEYLRHVLIRLTEFADLWAVPSLASMWKSVLTVPLTSVSAPLSSMQEEECLQTLVLLHRCPCVEDLNLIKFAQLYMRLELPVCALSTLLLLPDFEDRVTHADRLLANEALATVIGQLELYHNQSKQVPLLNQIDFYILNYVRRQSRYESLVGTSFAPRLALLLAQQDAIEELFMHLLENERTQELMQLLSLYQQMQPNLPYALNAAAIEESSEKIRLYAKLHNLERKASEFLPPEPESFNGEDSVDADQSP